MVVGQINGDFAVQGGKLAKYLEKVHKLQSYFDRVVLTKVSREESACADALAQVGSGTEKEINMSKRAVLVQSQPSISLETEMMQLEEAEPEWAHGIVRYLKLGELPQDGKQTKKVKLQSARYVMVGGVLYQKGYTTLLKCVSTNEVEYILKEIHEGICGNHSGGQILAHKVIRAWHYWPTMGEDAAEFVKRCDKC